MAWSQQFNRLLRLRRYLVLGLVAVGVVMGVLGDRVLAPIAKVCPAPPQYRTDVGEDVRAQLDLLHSLGLLYCGELASGQAILTEPLYWGSDGVNSIVFFQPETLQGVGIRTIAFGQGFEPPPPGDGPQAGFKPDLPGKATYRNQAPEGASYFYRLEGAPADNDYAVSIKLRGPAAVRSGLRRRDVFQDLELIAAFLRGQSTDASRRTVTAQASLPILPSRWSKVRQRFVSPELAGVDGRPTYAVISKAELPHPALYQVVNGPLGSTVWVAGVVSGTTPSLVLVPQAGDGLPVEPMASAIWYAPEAGVDTLLGEFAFPPQPSSVAFEARYWHAAAGAGNEQPDLTWVVEFLDWRTQRQEPEPGP